MSKGERDKTGIHTNLREREKEREREKLFSSKLQKEIVRPCPVWPGLELSFTSQGATFIKGLDYRHLDTYWTSTHLTKQDSGLIFLLFYPLQMGKPIHLAS
jgi:hypothetical protein